MAGGYAWYDTSTSDIYFKLFEKKALTFAEYLSTDPSIILQLVVDKYRSLGGTVNYTLDTIEFTGTEVSYTFNVNTILECISKCVELAPEN